MGTKSAFVALFGAAITISSALFMHSRVCSKGMGVRGQKGKTGRLSPGHSAATCICHCSFLFSVTHSPVNSLPGAATAALSGSATGNISGEPPPSRGTVYDRPDINDVLPTYNMLRESVVVIFPFPLWFISLNPYLLSFNHSLNGILIHQGIRSAVFLVSAVCFVTLLVPGEGLAEGDD
ncbi:hypothetical protein CDAR_487591 [Caerostris darwini]|uniref:Uncharacterized protein n=1 Tax=Caerostris darwini TaxID=1538125 RepID=A0AAV4PRA3_9ARAC|nr:hypothetical protein CDAR_487591 [Caerostris darwini]